MSLAAKTKVTVRWAVDCFNSATAVFVRAEIPPITFAELLPLAGIMLEPLPQVRAGNDLFQLEINRRLLLADLARPKPRHQNPHLIQLGRSFVEVV